MGGVRPKTKLWNDLQKKDCKTLEEFYAKTEKYLCVENAEGALGKAEPLPKTPRTRKKRKGNLKSLSRMIRNGSDLRIALHQLY